MYEFKMKFCEMVRGASAYEVAARNGFEGTEAEWVAALEGGAKDAQSAAQQAAAEAQAAAGRAGKAADSAGENADAAAASAEAAALSAAMARSHAVTAETRAADAQQARADAIAAAGDAAAAKQAAQSAAAEAAEAGTKATQAAQSAAAEANRAFQIEQSIKQYESSAAASKIAAARSAADAARSAKAAKQSDWNAAEGEAGHVLNRTHWAERFEMVEILPESTLSGEDGVFFITQPGRLTVGERYTVNWNGAEYPCTAVDMDGLPALANDGANLETGEGAVFLVGLTDAEIMPDSGIYGIAQPMDGSTSVTLSIYGPTEIVHELPSKYISAEIIASIQAAQSAADTAQQTADNNSFLCNSLSGTISKVQTAVSGKANSQNAIFNGDYFCAYAKRVSIGPSTGVSSEIGHAIGSGAYVRGDKGVAIGLSAEVGTGATASIAIGNRAKANKQNSIAMGALSEANGDCSVAIGLSLKASGRNSHVIGAYNIEDTENKYVLIVGNGEHTTSLSNAHTIDWGGNAWFAGSMTADGGIILRSSTADSTKLFKITVDDSGIITATEV